MYQSYSSLSARLWPEVETSRAVLIGHRVPGNWDAHRDRKPSLCLRRVSSVLPKDWHGSGGLLVKQLALTAGQRRRLELSCRTHTQGTSHPYTFSTSTYCTHYCIWSALSTLNGVTWFTFFYALKSHEGLCLCAQSFGND